ncbi:hypothetical protein HWC53_gp132 [Bacillus phage vB_BmeM-Goe8]|uniref:Uncharacterized protein n=1 Tax=Bacillus phage vB_BmeM-Goe8 TaxID=2593638 RepID=A0A516KN04_9CAUD|nr:hypothetical protein HWC53_gp132 [Bacillus phage vB_BmeM-Goe8]QDP42957.1 hypothetical protein Goe8_c01840 [Bacillus phage vB_BmeM-Goe8]
MAVREFPNKPTFVYFGYNDVRSVSSIIESTGQGVLGFSNRDHWDTRSEMQPVQLVFSSPDDVTAVMEMLESIRVAMEDKTGEGFKDE